MQEQQNKLLNILSELKITYRAFEHEASFHVGDNDEHAKDFQGARTKNLFLRNKKGHQHYLVVMKDNKAADLAKLREFVDDSKLGMASDDRLMQFLGVKPGSVSTFALINDLQKHVKVIVDQDIFEEKYVYLHPLINTQTFEISSTDYRRFLDYTGNHYSLYQF